MKVSAKYWQSGIAVVMVAMALIMSTPMVFADNINPGVLPPNSHPLGLTYGEWSARWWQYALSVPGVPGQDVFDGCPAEPSGHVWFLEGTNATPPHTRSCTVPSGRIILFPIINAEWSIVEAQANGNACFVPANPSGTSDEALRACAIAQMDLVTKLEASVDGKQLQDLTIYRALSPAFDFTSAPGNPLGVCQPDGCNSHAVADGFWIMLTPLSKGTHIVHFHGEISSLSFTIDTTYNLTIG